MLLDILTVFFIVAGCVLLWFNVRPKSSHAVPKKSEDKNHQSASSPHIQDNTAGHRLILVLEQHLSEAKADPQSSAEIAAGMVKAPQKPNLP